MTARSQSGCLDSAAISKGAHNSEIAGGAAPAMAIGRAPDAPGPKWRTTPATNRTTAAAAPAALPSTHSVMGSTT